MFKFPEGLYTDVRIEDVYETKIIYTMGEIEESKERTYKAAFIRIFDGEKWYYNSISNIEDIQAEIDLLSQYANPNEHIEENPVVKKFQVNKENLLKFKDGDIKKISIKEKQNLLKEYFPALQEYEFIKHWNAYYVDRKIYKEFYSSKGSSIKFDNQTTGLTIKMKFAKGDKHLAEAFQKSSNNINDIKGKIEEFKSFVSKCYDFLINSKPVEPGNYTVILSPIAAGVFAHESFGHKSEADFMIGDETMKREWAIGKTVGKELLSIVDDGNINGNGYVPYDDEGTRAEKTYLVKNGLLSGRLHSATTAYYLDEDLTGNARAINFEYEPIVRMTTTYIEPGNMTKEELFSEVENGIFIDDIKHGSGMSTFTIAPSLAYYIKNGKIADPVSISVVTGNVMETLNEIDGLSNETEIMSFILGGCGKMEQFPLPVGFGGPFVRVKSLNVQ